MFIPNLPFACQPWCQSLTLGDAVQPNSQFAAAYSKGINKLNYWEPVMEDSLDIIAKLPAIAALIYTNVYKGGNTIQADSKLDWAANLSHMMGMCFVTDCQHVQATQNT